MNGEPKDWICKKFLGANLIQLVNVSKKVKGLGMSNKAKTNFLDSWLFKLKSKTNFRIFGGYLPEQ